MNQAAARRRGAGLGEWTAGMRERWAEAGGWARLEGLCLNPKRQEKSPRMPRRCAAPDEHRSSPNSASAAPRPVRRSRELWAHARKTPSPPSSWTKTSPRSWSHRRSRRSPPLLGHLGRPLRRTCLHLAPNTKRISGLVTGHSLETGLFNRRPASRYGEAERSELGFSLSRGRSVSESHIAKISKVVATAANARRSGHCDGSAECSKTPTSAPNPPNEASERGSKRLLFSQRAQRKLL